MDVIPWTGRTHEDELNGNGPPLREAAETRLLRLQPLRILGAGGFGSVYKAIIAGHTVAVKKLHAKSKNPRAANQSFLAEIAAMGLDHPNVVRTYGVSSETLSPDTVIIMEYVGEHNLQTILSDPDQDMSFSRRLRYAYDVASALMYAHNKSVVHLDVKPANILITPGDDCKLGDFGCCQMLDRETGMVSPTNRSYLTGTFAYRAPELLKGELPSPRADIYSFGITLWQMLTRDSPFGNQNQHVVIFGVVAYNLRPSTPGVAQDGELSAEEYCYKELYEQCWHASVDLRPTAAEVVETLEIWKAHAQHDDSSSCLSDNEAHDDDSCSGPSKDEVDAQYNGSSSSSVKGHDDNQSCSAERNNNRSPSSVKQHKNNSACSLEHNNNSSSRTSEQHGESSSCPSQSGDK